MEQPTATEQTQPSNVQIPKKKKFFKKQEQQTTTGQTQPKPQ